ncbi:cob(I)yrinic acid a,c-diamide adenosyltransferase [Desulfonatronovibrio magnus]|uniref:cob(I)yrinic acid a,c-diamide adenosyltransferase n=1 Tax=Desulfonatronovibrio magnus TaxID=698827 RepID=UPI000A828CA8|nr:cob(I)yrinic acid a,c-diamide adenosyltransferase [Desulfonatronovibrio magnus]
MGEESQRQSLIMVYTGNGKGKTSACTGQAIRGHGAGLKVAFGQFLKRDGQAGEQKILKNILGSNFLASGKGFYRNKNDWPKHREGALQLIEWAEHQFENHCEMLILDEAVYALNMELISKDEIMGLIQKAREHNANLVLSGRDAPEWLCSQADMVSEIEERKHHFQKNIRAQKGIEY